MSFFGEKPLSASTTTPIWATHHSMPATPSSPEHRTSPTSYSPLSPSDFEHNARYTESQASSFGLDLFEHERRRNLLSDLKFIATSGQVTAKVAQKSGSRNLGFRLKERMVESLGLSLIKESKEKVWFKSEKMNGHSLAPAVEINQKKVQCAYNSKLYPIGRPELIHVRSAPVGFDLLAASPSSDLSTSASVPSLTSTYSHEGSLNTPIGFSLSTPCQASTPRFTQQNLAGVGVSRILTYESPTSSTSSILSGERTALKPSPTSKHTRTLTQSTLGLFPVQPTFRSTPESCSVNGSDKWERKLEERRARESTQTFGPRSFFEDDSDDEDRGVEEYDAGAGDDEDFTIDHGLTSAEDAEEEAHFDRIAALLRYSSNAIMMERTEERLERRYGSGRYL